MKALWSVEWKLGGKGKWRWWSAERSLGYARFEAGQVKESWGAESVTRIRKWVRA